MRGTWWALVLLAVACSKGSDGVGDDTADTGDTEDTDTGADTDTQPPPTPATYGPHNGVVFDMNPVNWVPLSYSRPIFTDEWFGYDVSFTMGANVTGKTDVSLTVDSKLDRESDGDYVQYFTGLKDGGKLDAEMHINFPMTIAIDSFQIDVSDLVLDETIPEAADLDWTFATHIFDTLNLSGDTESTTYVANPYQWTWTTGEFDPDPNLPFVTITVDADVNYETTFVTTSYEIRDVTSDALVATQLKKADRGDVESYVGALGEEAEQVRFDAKAKGELKNTLSIDITLAVTLRLNCCGSYTFDETFTFDLGDDGQWKITFDEERITHAKQ